MTKDELITKQQLEIEDYKLKFAENSKLCTEIVGCFYNIGAPLNDNILQMNKEQKLFCLKVVDLVEQINCV